MGCPGKIEKIYPLDYEKPIDLFFLQFNLNPVDSLFYFSFGLPFDLGIIEAQKKLVSKNDSSRSEIEEYGKIFIGEPYEVDREVSETLGLKTLYLNMIKTAKVELEA